MTTPTTKPTESEAHLKENERKWTKPLMDAGWTCIPNVLIERQLVLGLDPLDLNIILHLAARWWKAEGKPHPSKGTIAKAMKVHPSTIRRRIQRMEREGLIRREERRVDAGSSKTNIYHLEGLIKHAAPYADEKVAERAAAKEAREKAMARKGRARVPLKVIDGGADE